MKAALSSTARYSSIARFDISGANPRDPSTPRCRFASTLMRLASTVELDGSQIDVVLGGIAFDLCHLGRIAAGRLAHGGVHGVPRMGAGPSGQRAEVAGRAGDNDDLFHDVYPFNDEMFPAPRRIVGAFLQMIPP
jgi:hypothetical protein